MAQTTEIWDSDAYARFKDRLLQSAEDAYRRFNEKIIPDYSPILGVRMPVLRKLAKEIAKGNWRSYLKAARDDSHEEIMLQGMVIAAVSPKLEFSETLRYLTYYVPKLNNWSLVDAFCGDMKIIARHQQETYAFLTRYLKSAEEYAVRFAIVMLLHYYLDAQYLPEVFALFNSVRHTGYYVQMALAWAVSIAFVKMPEETWAYLRQNRLLPWTQQKALQKILESNRVTQETKAQIRRLKEQK